MLKIKSLALKIEYELISFFVKTAGRWANVLNKQVNSEVEDYYLRMVKQTEDLGHDWDYEKMSPLIDEMRRFRSENIKFAFGHVLAFCAILFSILAIAISVFK